MKEILTTIFGLLGGLAVFIFGMIICLGRYLCQECWTFLEKDMKSILQ